MVNRQLMPLPSLEAEAIPDSAMEEINRILHTGDLFRYTAASGSPVSRLEEKFAEYLEIDFALALNSCSNALFIALKALDLKPKARIGVPAFTFAAVPSAIVHADCQPVLINVGDNYRMNMSAFEAELEKGLDAVIISHMRGHTSDMDRIVSLSDKYNIPVIEDAAHSLGTRWRGRKIGTIGRIGCFSFQSYKLLNAGEGGMLVTEDKDLMARAIIMSGAYEQNWRKHAQINERCAFWQNKLPLYNMRMNNLSAAVLTPQVSLIEERAAKGLENYNYLAAKLEKSNFIEVPKPLEGEERAPDSIQFNLVNIPSNADIQSFHDEIRRLGIELIMLGLVENNARAYWNWQFIGPQGDLSQTKDMLMRVCDLRLPVQLESSHLDHIADIIVASAKNNFAR